MFGELDWDELIAPLLAAGVAFDKSGLKEIANWSGGIPVLTIALLGKLAERARPPTTCTKNEVDVLASAMLEKAPDSIRRLFEGT